MDLDVGYCLPTIKVKEGGEYNEHLPVFDDYFFCRIGDD